MSCKFKPFDLRASAAGTVVLPLCLILSACGGGGGVDSVASAPPPPSVPTPTPPPTFNVQISALASPASRRGVHDVIGSLTLTSGNGGPMYNRVVKPGEFTMSAAKYFDDDPLTYTLNTTSDIFPAGLVSISADQPFLSWSFNPPHAYDSTPLGTYCCQLLGQHLTASKAAIDGSDIQVFSYDFTRGSSGSAQRPNPNIQLWATLDYDIGYSYVAMGEWGWRVVDLNGTAAGDSGNLLFVNGDRTPASGIPASGTATYDARSLGLLSSAGTPGIPFALTADFGQRTMAARIDQDYRFNGAAGAVDPILGIHVGGSAPFSNDGAFAIPLTGTANYASTNLMTAPPAEPVAGSMNGAFFGPAAEQVGGVFSVNRPGGTLLMQDAFVGRQH